MVYSKVSPGDTDEESHLLLPGQSFIISITAPCLPPPNNLICTLFFCCLINIPAKTRVCLSCIMTFLHANRLKIEYEYVLMKGRTGPIGLLTSVHPWEFKSLLYLCCKLSRVGLLLLHDCTEQGTRSS